MSNLWLALRRPLLLALMLACTVSLITSGRVTLRLLLPALVYWSVVPLCEIASLAAVSRGRKLPFALLIDTFFMGHTVWFLLLTAFAALWAFVPPVTASGWPFSNNIWHTAAWLALGWSAYVDFRFFQRVLGRSWRRAALELVVQRAICWTAALTIFLAPAGAQVVQSAFGL